MTAVAPSTSTDFWTLPRLLAAVALYGVAHTLVRVVFSEVQAVDATVETVFSQTLAWGYNPKYPPLYTWLLWATETVVGPGVLATLILKYALLTVAAGFFFTAARRVIGDAGWAALATFSASLLYQIGYNYHEGFTHTLTLIPAGTATLWMVLRLCQDRPTAAPGASPPSAGRWVDYAILGFLIGIGALSKHTYFIGLGTLIVAMLLQPAGREALWSRRLFLTLAIAVAVALPHQVWVLAQPVDLGSEAARTLVPTGSEAGFFAQRGAGLMAMTTGTLGFLSPWLPLVILAAPTAFAGRGMWRPPVPAGAATDIDPARLVRDACLTALLFLLFIVLAFGVTRLPERWMHPLFLIAPIWVFAGFSAMPNRAAIARRLTVVILAVAAIALGWRFAGFTVASPLFCGKCRLEVPISELATEMRAAGFDRGTIIGGDEFTAGSLRAQFPDSRIISLHMPDFRPPAPRGAAADDPDRLCAIVWQTDAEGKPTAPPAAALDLADPGPGAIDSRLIAVPYGHLFQPDDYKVGRWRLALLAPGGDCL